MQERGYAGRFAGARLDVESVPRLPVIAARRLLDDPRGLPYFVGWRSPEEPGLFAYALRLECDPGTRHAVRIVFADGRTQALELEWRDLPRGGQDVRFRCPECGRPCRFLYFQRPSALGPFPAPPLLGWAACSRCCGLRWACQGGHRSSLQRAVSALITQETGRRHAPLPRKPWNPVVVSSPLLLAGKPLEGLLEPAGGLEKVRTGAGPYRAGPREDRTSAAPPPRVLRPRVTARASSRSGSSPQPTPSRSECGSPRRSASPRSPGGSRPSRGPRGSG